MDRFRLFHKVITHCNLLSMHSVLTTCLDEMISCFDVERALYMAIGVGGPRVIAARSDARSDIPNPNNIVDRGVLQKVMSTNSVFSVKMPVIPAGLRATASWGRAEIKGILAIPVLVDNQLRGMGYFERKGQLPPFQHREIDGIQQILEDVELVLNNSRRIERQSFELDQMKSEITKTKINMISEHPKMLRLFRQIDKLAGVPSTVLIFGESGTGKELVAEAIYNLSGMQGPFISMNCGAIEPNLMKSELFGHIKGSFTGAHKDRIGLFKKAENGILFMDEIGEMPLDMQVALLRTLECGEILPVGSDRPLIVHTRVLAATHRDLSEMVDKGQFRNDLYQRLKGITLRVPPLRERRSDVPLLAEHFLKKYNDRLDQNYSGFTDEAMDILMSRNYESGNVRELQHIVERAMVFEDNPRLIGTDYIQQGDRAEREVAWDFESKVSGYARKLLLDAIEACGGNKTKAMEKLGLPRTTFYNMLNRYGIMENGA